MVFTFVLFWVCGSGGRGRSMVMKDYNRERPKGSGGGRGGGKDKIDALGRLLYVVFGFCFVLFSILILVSCFN